MTPTHFVSAACRGEHCSVCDHDATHKIGEEVFHDDPNPYRHNLTAYVCCLCFGVSMKVICPGTESGKAVVEIS